MWLAVTLPIKPSDNFRTTVHGLWKSVFRVRYDVAHFVSSSSSRISLSRSRISSHREDTVAGPQRLIKGTSAILISVPLTGLPSLAAVSGMVKIPSKRQPIVCAVSAATTNCSYQRDLGKIIPPVSYARRETGRSEDATRQCGRPTVPGY